ncbi:MAG TPA: hypothetical protein VMD30_00235 [Tepidisphaeraceae bacterium]|nr:hypothetical protein [Tepidisphaeraceae bacterium]
MRSKLIRLAASAGLCLGAVALTGCRHAQFSGGLVIAGPVYTPPPPPPPPPYGVVVVDTAPPPPQYDAPPPYPAPVGYIWVGGYYNVVGGRYVWVRGHYDRPPRPGMRYHAPVYRRDAHGHYYVGVKGGWR